MARGSVEGNVACGQANGSIHSRPCHCNAIGRGFNSSWGRIFSCDADAISIFGLKVHTGFSFPAGSDLIPSLPGIGPFRDYTFKS